MSESLLIVISCCAWHICLVSMMTRSGFSIPRSPSGRQARGIDPTNTGKTEGLRLTHRFHVYVPCASNVARDKPLTDLIRQREDYRMYYENAATLPRHQVEVFAMTGREEPSLTRTIYFKKYTFAVTAQQNKEDTYRQVCRMHLSRRKLCTKKTELALEVKFCLDFH